MDILQAKLMGIKVDLCHAWTLGYHHVVCESDSCEAIHLINSEEAAQFHFYGALIADIAACLRHPWYASIAHALRESNS